MIEQVRRNFYSGVERIRWFSEVVSERIKIEIAVVKLMGKAERLKKEKDELARAIGERFFESRAQMPDTCKDGLIRNILIEMEMVNEELDKLKARLANMTKPFR